MAFTLFLTSAGLLVLLVLIIALFMDVTDAPRKLRGRD
jgi:hypothetical protein